MRGPGQHAFEMRDRLRRRGLAICAAALVVAAAAWALGGSWLVIVFAEVMAVAAARASERFLLPRVESWSRGAEGERVVGELLESFTDAGWRVMHDVTVGSRGNIDHLLIGPGGVFTVETKNPRSGRVYDAMLTQAYAQKKLVERMIQRDVTALLVFSHIAVRRRRRRGVDVLSAFDVYAHLARRPAVLAPADVERITATLRAALA